MSALTRQALHDPSLYARTTAARALAATDLVAARQVMDFALRALGRPEVRARQEACAVLGSLGPVAKPAVPDLVAALNDPEESLRAQAVAALGGIGLPATEVIAALGRALHDPTPIVRHRAASQFAFALARTAAVSVAICRCLSPAVRDACGAETAGCMRRASGAPAAVEV